MNNELALLVIFVAWLKMGRGHNLCLVIIVYYVLYEITYRLLIHNPEIYFTSQILIDSCILYACLLLAYKNVKQSIIILLYGLVVFSSLLMDSLRLVDEVSNTYYLLSIYDARQEYSHALDIFFALIGGGRSERSDDSSLFIRLNRVYNGFINPKADI